MMAQWKSVSGVVAFEEKGFVRQKAIGLKEIVRTVYASVYVV